MSNNKNDYLIKHGRRSCRNKHRLKSSIVRDPNGSMSTFRQFYQSGGRDYEQYRLWLQTLSQPKQLSSPSDDSNEIKKESVDNQFNIVTALPPSQPSIHSQQPLPRPRISCSHPLLKSVRHVPISTKSQYPLPLSTFSPPQLTTISFKPQVLLPFDHSHFPPIPVASSSSSSSSSSLNNWSVTDVGQFIEKHFPEKKIVQKFIQQKIDGRALPLLTEDHLTRIFKMKLGPALYLLALISNMQN